MSVAHDILRSYWHPGAVMREKLAAGEGEERALAYVMIACVLFFAAQVPLTIRQVSLAPEGPEFAALISGRFLGAVLLAPLALYALAGASHALARLIGGQGNWQQARLALFWSLLVIAPLKLLGGLVGGYVGPGLGTTLISTATGAVFLAIWALTLIEVEGRGNSHAA